MSLSGLYAIIMSIKNLGFILATMCMLTGCVTDGSFPILSSDPAPAQPAQNTPAQPAKTIIGWVERVKVGDIDYLPKAKLDTGAKTSSLDAEIIRTFKRDGTEFIVFRTRLGDENAKPQIFESELKRWVRIKKKKESEGYIRRPVVEMTLCLAGKLITGEVNLSDRDHFSYPILIGRNMLSSQFMIDTSKTFTRDPQCSAAG